MTESLSVTQSLSSLSSPSLSHRMSSSDPSKALLMQHFLKDMTIMLSGMAFHAADNHRAISEGAARKGWLKERCELEPRTNFFFRLRNRQKLIRVRFGRGLDSRIYGNNFLDSGFESQGEQYIFLFYKTPRTALEPFQSPVQWLPGFFSRGKAAGAWSWPLPST